MATENRLLRRDFRSHRGGMGHGPAGRRVGNDCIRRISLIANPGFGLSRWNSIMRS